MGDNIGLKELADATGLSMSTVSRALSGSSLVNDRTRQRILAVASVGHLQGKKLRPRYANQAGTAIALIQPSLELTDGNTEVSVQILEAMQDVAEKRQCHILAGRLQARGNNQNNMNQFNNTVLGAVGFRLLDEHVQEFIAQAKEADVPFVLLNRTEDDPRVPTCTVDHTLAGRLAASHLVDLGHRNIAVFSSHSHIQANRFRLRGISQVLTERSIRQPAGLTHGDLNDTSLIRAALEAVVNRHKATAVIASCDRMALNILRLLPEMGLKAPRDLSVIGFDGSQSGAEFQPALTSVQIPWNKMAAGAAKLLFWLREDPQLEQVHLSWSPMLIERQSTAPPRAIK